MAARVDPEARFVVAVHRVTRGVAPYFLSNQRNFFQGLASEIKRIDGVELISSLLEPLSVHFFHDLAHQLVS